LDIRASVRGDFPFEAALHWRAVAGEIRYADSGDLQIAYTVRGDGPLDIVFTFDWASNIDLMWANPQNERFLRRFTNYGRLIMFDMQGVGLSDPIVEQPALEDWMDDVAAVMEAVGSERAALVGHGHGAQACMLFAASHPDRTAALVTINGYARLARDDDYPAGMPASAWETSQRFLEERWGSGLVMVAIGPGTETPDVVDLFGRTERAFGSPRRAARRQQMIYEIDVRDVLPSIQAPTLVLHTRDNQWVRPGHGRYLAERIPGAAYLEVEGRGHWPWATEGAERCMDAIEEFLTGTTRGPELDRVLLTVAFTDIVGSTELAASLGDRRWRDLLETHDSVVRREVTAARGRLVKSTGDGLMATFDGPARAIRCIHAIGQQLASLGVPIRAGLHTGEVELIGDDIGGIAVHIASRLSSLAGPAEILVSSTVKDLVAGSGITFEDRGTHVLKGVPDEWRVFAAS
jgi:class 3 adenylate cyclase/predicted alpha/beta hydrolase family esterase